MNIRHAGRVNPMVMVLLLVAPACGGDEMNLNDAIDRLRPLVDELHITADGPGVATSDVEQSSPRACRSGINELDGTAQISFSYTVSGLDRSGADSLVAAVERRLVAAGAQVDVEEEPDLDRPVLRANRDDERFTVLFASADAGATATVSAVTGCHEAVEA